MVFGDVDPFPSDPSKRMDTDLADVGDDADQFCSDASKTLDSDVDGIRHNAETNDYNDGVVDGDDDWRLYANSTSVVGLDWLLIKARKDQNQETEAEK